MGATLKGSSEDFHRKGGKIAENGALTDLNRRYFDRGVPSDGLRRYAWSILKTQGKSEAQMPLKQGSNAPCTWNCPARVEIHDRFSAVNQR